MLHARMVHGSLTLPIYYSEWDLHLHHSRGGQTVPETLNLTNERTSVVDEGGKPISFDISVALPTNDQNIS